MKAISGNDEIKKLIVKNWFLVGVLVAILVARANPDLGRKGGPLKPEFTINTLGPAVIFFFSGLSLPTSQLKAAMFQVKLHALVQVWSFIVVPLVTAVVVAILRTIVLTLFPGATPEDTPALVLLQGLTIVACMPPPCSTGVILAQAIGGNEGAAVFNATLGSFLGVFITPLLLLFMVGTPVSVPLTGIFVKLSGMIMMPVLCGQGVRLYLEDLQKKKNVDLGSPTGTSGEKHWLLKVPGSQVASGNIVHTRKSRKMQKASHTT